MHKRHLIITFQEILVFSFNQLFLMLKMDNDVVMKVVKIFSSLYPLVSLFNPQ